MRSCLKMLENSRKKIPKWFLKDVGRSSLCILLRCDSVFSNQSVNPSGPLDQADQAAQLIFCRIQNFTQLFNLSFKFFSVCTSVHFKSVNITVFPGAGWHGLIIILLYSDSICFESLKFPLKLFINDTVESILQQYCRDDSWCFYKLLATCDLLIDNHQYSVKVSY